MDICVYGASGDRLDGEYFSAAYELGRLIALGGHRLIFGGGSGGLMGACARGAVDQGGQVTGIAPRFFDQPGVLFDRCEEFIFTDTMSRRKQLMEERSGAFIALPGGIGTFEEFFETLTLKQLGRHSKPMALVNTLGYYDPLMDMLGHAASGGFMSESCFRLFACCGSPEEALRHALTAPAVTGGLDRYAK